MRHLTNSGYRGASAVLGFTRARAAAASDSPAITYVCRASVTHSRPKDWELTFSSGDSRDRIKPRPAPRLAFSLIQRLLKSRLSSSHRNTPPQAGGFNNRSVFSQFWKLGPKIKVLAGLVSGEASFSDLSTTTFSLCPHVASLCRERAAGVSSFSHSTGPVRLGPPLWPHSTFLTS